MKTPLKQLALTIAAVLTIGYSAHADTAVYVNTNATPQNVRFSIGNFEVGDEVTLGAPGIRVLTTIAIQIWGTNFNGGETLKFTLYANNGSLDVNNNPRPSQVLYTETFGVAATEAANLVFDLTANNIVLPNTFTFAVQFQGIGAGEGAGVYLYANPSIGTSFTDYWDNDGVNWTLKTNANPAINMNFAAEVHAVPEPGTLALGVLGGFTVLVYSIRRKRNS